MDILLELITFARAGGGGSGGGYGGSGGLSTGFVGIAMWIGAGVSYVIGRFVNKLLPRTPELIIGTLGAGISTLIFVYMLLSSLGTLTSYIYFGLIVGVWLGWSAAFFSAWDHLKAKAKKARAKFSKAAAHDSAWNEERLLAHAQQIFLRYQADWSANKSAEFGSYMTPRYAKHSALFIQILDSLKRKNNMSDVTVIDALIVDLHDDLNNSYDSYSVGFKARALDELIDIRTQKVLYKSNSVFHETWRFVRTGDTWLLDGIDQTTADEGTTVHTLQEFAKRHKMFYSLDMGNLFIPYSGVLVHDVNYSMCDINNHVVGIYNNFLTQFYTLRFSRGYSYMVAQITLPKSHEGGIVVRPRRRLLNEVVAINNKNYKKYSFEWEDFNKKYEVFATDMSRLAAFELVNPGFMAFLHDNDPEAVIEATDNIVLVYKPVVGIDAKDYDLFMQIVQRAHKELKQ